jgi:hypothetical protein
MKVMPCGDYFVTVEVSCVSGTHQKPWRAHWAVYKQAPRQDCAPLVTGDTEFCEVEEEANRFARAEAYWAGEALLGQVDVG